MPVTPIALNDICNSLHGVFHERCNVYGLPIDERRKVLNTFLNGEGMFLEIVDDPSKAKRFSKYFQDEKETQMDIPDDLSELE